ncbi:14768_t:CDS:2, partial [Funneliformis geosporum]
IDENYNELHFDIKQAERELLKEVRILDDKGIEANDYIESSLIKKAEKGQGLKPNSILKSYEMTKERTDWKGLAKIERAKTRLARLEVKIEKAKVKGEDIHELTEKYEKLETAIIYY